MQQRIRHVYQRRRLARSRGEQGLPEMPIAATDRQMMALALIKETFQISCEGKKIDESGD
jgi:hypothetical protein